MPRRRLRAVLALGLVLAVTGSLAVVVALLVRPWLGGLGPVGTALLAVVVAVVFAAFQLRYVRQETLAEIDARPVDETEYPALIGRLRRLAATADAPVPTVAVVETATPNSCSVAGPTGGTIVVSTGLLDRLDDEELDAVLAHELAHLRNRDGVIVTLASFLPAVVEGDYSPVRELGIDRLGVGTQWLLGGVLVVVGYLLAVPSVPGAAFSLASLGAYAVGLVALVVGGGVAVGVGATVAAVATRRLTRTREFAADRAAARITGAPARLAAVLERLSDAPTTPDRDERHAARAASHAPHVTAVCLLPHGFDTGDEPEADASGGGHLASDADEHPITDSETDDDRNPTAGFGIRTRSHPPATERIAALRELVNDQETT